MLTVIKMYVKMPCLVGSGYQIFLFALSLGLIFLSASLAINLTLPLRVWGVFGESLCVTSDTTASGGRSD